MFRFDCPGFYPRRPCPALDINVMHAYRRFDPFSKRWMLFCDACAKDFDNCIREIREIREEPEKETNA